MEPRAPSCANARPLTLSPAPQCSGLGVFLSGRRLLPGGGQLLRWKYLLGKQYYLQVKCCEGLILPPHLLRSGGPTFPRPVTRLRVSHNLGPGGLPGAPEGWPHVGPAPGVARGPVVRLLFRTLASGREVVCGHSNLRVVDTLFSKFPPGSW